MSFPHSVELLSLIDSNTTYIFSKMIPNVYIDGFIEGL